MKNIIVMFNDDHAQWALNCYGNGDLITPNLDHLARTGVVVENAYTPVPVCSPARASFLTGLLPSQHGVHDYLSSGEFSKRNWIANFDTLPEKLQRKCYQTALCGKWHLGDDMRPQPGFDHWFALSGDYPVLAAGSYNFSRNGAKETRNGYKSQIVTDEAITFMRKRDTDSPFFLFVGHTATHSPWAGHPRRLVSQYESMSLTPVNPSAPYPFGENALESSDLRPLSPRHGLDQYYAAVSSIDESLGRILDELDAQGIADETLVLYTSDHGLCCGHHGIWGKGNGTLPLNMLEQSIRVPMIFHAPGTISPGRISDRADHMDVFQTLLDIAGVNETSEDEYPGQSLFPLLSGDGLIVAARQTQFCEYGALRMARSDRFKLLVYKNEEPSLFFDLVEDPDEHINRYDDTSLSSEVTDLRRQMDDFFARYESTEHSGFADTGPARTNESSPWSLAAQ